LQNKGIRFIHMILDKDGVGPNESRILLYDFNANPIDLGTSQGGH